MKEIFRCEVCQYPCEIERDENDNIIPKECPCCDLGEVRQCHLCDGYTEDKYCMNESCAEYIRDNKGMKRKVNITLVDRYKPYANCGSWFVETTLSDEELQDFLDKHEREDFPGEYSTDTFNTALEKHKDINPIECDFDEVYLDF